MSDGKIVREDCIGSPIEEDLKIWQHSGLGRRIMQKKTEELAMLAITMEQMQAMREFLSQNAASD